MSKLLNAALFTLENLDYAAEHRSIRTDRVMQAQLGESAKMLREAISAINDPPKQEKTKVLQPYTHDCANCVWMGWVLCKKAENTWGNMYYCPPKNQLILNSMASGQGSIITRYGDQPDEYLCVSFVSWAKKLEKGGAVARRV